MRTATVDPPLYKRFPTADGEVLLLHTQIIGPGACPSPVLVEVVRSVGARPARTRGGTHVVGVTHVHQPVWDAAAARIHRYAQEDANAFWDRTQYGYETGPYWSTRL